MKILRTNHMIQYFLSEPIKMHPKKGEETEMTLLPISRSLSCQTLCFSFGCREENLNYTNAHMKRGSEHWEAVVMRC